MKAVRIGLCVLFAFSVLAHGVVEVWSESILEIGASLLFITWVFLAYRDPEITIQWNPLNWPFLGLHRNWSCCNSHFIGARIRFSLESNCFDSAPTSSSSSSAAQAFREREDLVKLTWFLVLLGFSVSLLGIIQLFYVPRHDLLDPKLSRGRRYVWTLCESQSLCRICGTGCARRTSAAGVSRSARELFPMTGLLTIIPVGALILSGSRGGIMCFAFEVAVLVLLARTRKGTAGRYDDRGCVRGTCFHRANRLAGRRKSDRTVFENAGSAM